MSETHLDHPGEWHWFHSYGPKTIVGSCPHDTCPHNATITIAYGPDYEHYELIVCDVDDGCNGKCRGWTREYPASYANAHGVQRITWPENYLGWMETVSDNESATLTRH